MNASKINSLLESNIINKNECTKVISQTMQCIADSLSKSLGPYGAPTLIQDRAMQHKITKDGYTILKHMTFFKDIPRTILDEIRSISSNQVRMVGDGTTSSIIIANAIYQKFKNDNKDIKPKLVSDGIKYIYEIITESKNENINIHSYKNEVSDDMDELVDIASVSCNNDEVNGQFICNLYREIGKYGIVTLENSKTSETYYRITKGIELPRGFTNLLMINNKNERSAEYNTPFVYMVDDTIGEEDIPYFADLIGRVCNTLKQSLVIVAKGFASQFDAFLQANLVNNRDLPIVCIPFQLNDQNDKEKFQDLATLLGATIVQKSYGESLNDPVKAVEKMGTCSRIKSTEHYSQFIEGGGSPDEIELRKTQIEKEIKDLLAKERNIDIDNDLFKLRKRYAGLNNSLAVLYVGGNSDAEKETNRYLLEDAVFACRSALNNGYTVGGNLIIPIIIVYHYDEVAEELKAKFGNRINHLSNNGNDFINTLLDSVISGIKESFFNVVNNHFDDVEKSHEIVENCVNTSRIFNLVTMEYDDIDDTSIINSVDTDIQIFKSVSSIIGLLATINQVLTINTRQDNFR